MSRFSSSLPESSAENGSGPLAGRVALVTGASRARGIGAALVRRLLSDGASVLATGWTGHDEEMLWGADARGGAGLAAQLDPGDGRFHYREADLSDPTVPDALAAETVARFGGIDLLIANHARSSHLGFGDVTVEELDLCWQVNARASVLLAQSFSRHRRDRPTGGRFVHFTSGQHIGPMAGEIAYAVSKGAIHQMTASLADALADEGITVNCINPGPTDSGWAGPRQHAVVAEMFPSGRWGTTDDVANLVAWLCGDQAEWITGQVLNSEGGFRRWARPVRDEDA